MPAGGTLTLTTANVVVSDAGTAGAPPLQPKPFTPGVLTARIRQLLDRAP